MDECFGKRFILNGELQPAELFDARLVYDGNSVYEVLRMVRGIPVFYKDHFERLEKSVKLQRKDMLADIQTLRRAIVMLTRSEGRKETNLKIVFNYNHGSRNWLLYFIEPLYPSAEQYRSGVRGILFRAERKNPESKVINHRLRSAIYHRLILEGAYEALLVNENNMITEGSRSNIFFVKGKKLITAPDELVLSGITRKHILEICRDNKIKVEMRCVIAADVNSYDSVFMTGTSPMVLPFCCIDNVAFRVDVPLMATLRELYMAKAAESIKWFRSE